MTTLIIHEIPEEPLTERSRKEDPDEPRSDAIVVRESPAAPDCRDSELLRLYVEML